MLKIILGLPVLILKTVFRTISLTMITFPITGWFIMPGFTNGEIGKMIATFVILTLATIIWEIVQWIKEYNTLQHKSIVFW